MNIFSCGNSTDKVSHSAEIRNERSIGYNLSDPDKTIILPDILQEISGITVIDSSTVACVQDENGILYIFDLFRQEIKKQIHFHSNGDYEGITSVDKTIYILRSDGVIFEIPDYESSNFSNKILLAGIPSNDYEGLCYDKRNHRLLIAPKGKTADVPEYKNIRPVFGFDLSTGTLIKAPSYKIDLSLLRKFASENMVTFTERSRKKIREIKPGIRFRPSAIGIHPLTNELFVLSGIEQMLFVFDNNGTIKYIEKLNPKIFNQPEGISFLKNGDMLISNEGQNKKPTILRFNFKPD